MGRHWMPDGNHVDTECDSPERPADKAALEEWIAEARAKQAGLDVRSFDQRREHDRLQTEIDEYLEELFVWVMRGEMDAELA